MSQTPPKPPKPPPVPTRPYLFDYFLLLLGFGLSQGLMELTPFTIEPAEFIPHPVLRATVVFLPRLLRVSEGVILFLPLFFIPQFVLGRRQEIASGEWLWSIAWFGTVTLTIVAALRGIVLQTEFVDAWLPVFRYLWYLGFGSAMALIGVLMGLYGLIRRGPMPWTHGLGLVLVVWPVLPMIAILLTKK